MKKNSWYEKNIFIIYLEIKKIFLPLSKFFKKLQVIRKNNYLK